MYSSHAKITPKLTSTDWLEEGNSVVSTKDPVKELAGSDDSALDISKTQFPAGTSVSNLK